MIVLGEIRSEPAEDEIEELEEAETDPRIDDSGVDRRLDIEGVSAMVPSSLIPRNSATSCW